MSDNTPAAALAAALAEVGLDDIAVPLGEAISKIADGAAGKATEPIRIQHARQLEEAAERDANASLDAFGKAHPDWQPGNDLDQAMAKLSRQFELARDPKTGRAKMSDGEYLEHLHRLATRDRPAAPAAAPASNESKTPPKGATFNDAAAESKTPPKGATFNDAAAAAKRGVRWE